MLWPLPGENQPRADRLPVIKPSSTTPARRPRCPTVLCPVGKFDRGVVAHEWVIAVRAPRELAAASHRARAHRAGRVDAPTAKEARIARLAVIGRTNQEIGAQLFLSPRTVEWHLGRVFAKLRITSRQQLRDALRAAPGQRIASAS
jgi:DNA-binding CsgD family transcriptional regulator